VVTTGLLAKYGNGSCAPWNWYGCHWQRDRLSCYMPVGGRAYFSRYIKHFLDSHEWRRWIGQNGGYPCRISVPGVIWRSWFLPSKEANLAFDWSGCGDLMTHSWNFSGWYVFLASLLLIMHSGCRRALLPTFVNIFVILRWRYAEIRWVK
jgi:hypothetical protein